MQGSFLAHQFELNHRVAHAVPAGITHEESLVHPAPAGNCLNWVLGHVVATRNMLMDIVGEPHILSDLEAQPYQRRARPPLHADQAMLLPDIMAAFRPIAGHPDAAPRGAAGRTRPQAAGLSFHESYHLGQCGLLRASPEGRRDCVTPRRTRRSMLITSQWTGLDVVAHLGSWAVETRREAEALLEGRRPDYAIHFEREGGPRAWNQREVDARAALGLSELVEELTNETERLAELVLWAPQQSLEAVVELPRSSGEPPQR